MAGRIFMSYRRADTANQAGWLADRLAGHFGRSQVVRDVDSIQLGNDFADVIAAAVTSCDVLLALIGPQWLAAPPGDDYVRVEIESALTRGVQVIPVLVDGARMPTAAELPPSLALLAQRPPLSLGAANPEADVSRMIQALDQSIAQRMTERQATQAGLGQNQPTVTGMAPSWGPPAIHAQPGQPQPAQPESPASNAQPATAQAGPVRASQPTKQMRRRPKTWVIAAAAAAVVAAVVVAVIVIPGEATPRRRRLPPRPRRRRTPARVPRPSSATRPAPPPRPRSCWRTTSPPARSAGSMTPASQPGPIPAAARTA